MMTLQKEIELDNGIVLNNIEVNSYTNEKQRKKIPRIVKKISK